MIIACKTFAEYVKYNQPVPKEILEDIVEFVEYLNTYLDNLEDDDKDAVIEDFLCKMEDGS